MELVVVWMMHNLWFVVMKSVNFYCHRVTTQLQLINIIIIIIIKLIPNKEIKVVNIRANSTKENHPITVHMLFNNITGWLRWSNVTFLNCEKSFYKMNENDTLIVGR